MRNLATRARPDGGALAGIVEKFVTTAIEEAKESGRPVEDEIESRLKSLRELVGGYDLASVIADYYRGHSNGNETLMRDAERWLRAEFTTKTDARNALGVRTIIDDDNWYDHAKLMARFVRLAGYSGFIITLDEMVNLYKLGSSQARSSNYEQILRILNDCLQGTSEGLGFLLGGTPEFLIDPRRGLYSYQALASRLSENTFAVAGLTDRSGPVIRLQNLAPEDLLILLGRLRNVFAYGDESKYLVPDEALTDFMTHCSKKIGDAYFRTPRTTIKAFLDFLAVLDQNPQANWTDLIEHANVVRDLGPDSEPTTPDDDDDELATLRL